MSLPSEKQIAMESEMAKRRSQRIDAELDECDVVLDRIRERHPRMLPSDRVALAAAVITSLALSDLGDSVGDSGQRVINNLVDIETAVASAKR